MEHENSWTRATLADMLWNRRKFLTITYIPMALLLLFAGAGFKITFGAVVLAFLLYAGVAFIMNKAFYKTLLCPCGKVVFPESKKCSVCSKKIPAEFL